MRPDINEINIHLLLSNDINRLRETGKEKYKSLFSFDIFLYLKALSKLLKMTQKYCNPDDIHNYETM
jgi:hypothetical protein